MASARSAPSAPPRARLVVERLGDGDEPAVRALLADLALEEQGRYDHPRQDRAELERGMPPLSAGFRGESVIFVAREAAGAPPAGVCWCVLFDPGTGLEGEVAELYVRPDARGRGMATRLLRQAVALFRARRVTFACVWTRNDNAAAMAAYNAAGFRPTEQTVLTWLPLGRR